MANAEAALPAFPAPEALSGSLARGVDVLGDAYMAQVPAAQRRLSGSTYTPPRIVEEMLAMVGGFQPEAVVDCGCGSGRFALACAAAFPNADVYAVDNSADACLMCRANVAAAGLSDRVTVIQQDFLEFSLPPGKRGRTLWIANPPYVRHHDIAPSHKRWFKQASARLGIAASGLSGMHAYFLAKVAELWRPGDRGVFVTSAEWLDVNYGSFMKSLLLDRLGLDELHVHDKSSRVFETADTTAAVFSFGTCGEWVTMATPSSRGTFRRDALQGMQKWSHALAGVTRVESAELVPLGSYAAVHRGVVTGNNRFWVRSPEELQGIPETLTVPIVSHAREITGTCAAQEDPSSLARLIVLPADLDALEGEEATAARGIVDDAMERGIPEGYVASRRRPWWHIAVPEPPALMMTYMARRAPTFVVNRQGLPMLNVVHGIYPKVALSQRGLARLAEYLNASVSAEEGRTYCGGLVKFEPKEAEALLVPTPTALEGEL